MYKNSIRYSYSVIYSILIILALQACKSTEIPINPKPETQLTRKDTIPWRAKHVEESVFAFLNHPVIKQSYGNVLKGIKPTKLSSDTVAKRIEVHFSSPFSYIPFREENTDEFYSIFRSLLPDSLQQYELSIQTLSVPIEQLIPNSYRKRIPIDSSRLQPFQTLKKKPIVRNANPLFPFDKSLANHPIALWHSHGWYYNQKENRWMWQRARIFGTVEDLYPASIVLPYIVPMLENAGSNVFLPRERDTQINEVIVDNTNSDFRSKYSELGSWKNGQTKGFSIGKRPLKDHTNPFKTGTYRETLSDKKGNNQVAWTPDIPEDGDYAVYISYHASAENSDEVLYTVYYSGGEQSFYVNQQIGGSTWIYLGTFHFKKGLNPKTQKVVLSSISTEAGKRITADAVRFGGGMGIVERNGSVSGRPKYVEGARYWMQYAGFPDSLVYDISPDSDYNSDYQGRGEWVNYLVGAPFGPNKKREVAGLGIPIELSLAFHTDAGVTGDDRTIGTLMIYSIEDNDSSRVFPNGQSRLANRDLGDLMQTEIVETVRTNFDSTFTRRNLYNRMYSEAYRQNTPSVLLELLSHQNFSDMKHGLDPQFKFDIARAIYKSMARFVAQQHQKEIVIQPLPVSHVSVVLNELGHFHLKWLPVADPTEPTAKPDAYIVYIRENDEGFDQGRLVTKPEFILENPKRGTIYSFKVEAVNAGGKSMPSEILSAGLPSKKGKTPVMIVNGFTRISGPSFISSGNFEGFTHFNDRGVPDKYDFSFVGDQYNFDKTSRWVTDDEPGFGASYANFETQIIAGNTFDFAKIHGKAVLEAGYPFVSTSVAAVMDNYIDLTFYKYVDFIFGEQKSTSRTRTGYDALLGRKFEVYPEKLRYRLNFYVQTGGNLLISGAYITTDAYRNPKPDTTLTKLTEHVLQIKHRTDHASVSGQVFTVLDSKVDLPKEFTFNTVLSKQIYQVESADGIEPSSQNGNIVARYKENNISAITAFEGYYKTVVMGFPFETILKENDRNSIMKAILNFFDKTRE